MEKWILISVFMVCHVFGEELLNLFEDEFSNEIPSEETIASENNATWILYSSDAKQLNKLDWLTRKTGGIIDVNPRNMQMIRRAKMRLNNLRRQVYPAVLEDERSEKHRYKSDGRPVKIRKFGSSQVSPQRNFLSRNVTCKVTKTEECQIRRRVPLKTRCRIRFFYHFCYRYVIEVTTMECEKEYEDCCEGYKVGPSGYCEETSGKESGCGGNWLIRNKTGILYSPNYPQEYEDYLNCEWRIQSPPGTRIALKILDMDLENPMGSCNLEQGNCYNLCIFDALTITDRANIKMDTRSLCGEIPPQNEIISKSNLIDISFTSDLSTAGRGFKISYNTLTTSELNTKKTCPLGQVWKTCRRICKLSCSSYKNNMNTTANDYVPCNKYDGGFDLVRKADFHDVVCEPGCECPDTRPVYQNGKCVVVEECNTSEFSAFKCGNGVSSRGKKIVGGETALDGSWPWMVQLTTNDLVTDCGASLICSKWLLTAAHCFVDKSVWRMPTKVPRNMYWFHVGKYWKKEQLDRRYVQSFRAKRVIIHPSYDFDRDLNDIALVELNGYIKNTDEVKPVCMPQALESSVISEKIYETTTARPQVGELCITTGWGTTHSTGPSSEKLKQLLMPITPTIACNLRESDFRLVLCAGGLPNADTCKGDSGGPLACLRDDKWHIDGITSFGEGCGTGWPGGYTRVSHYVTWIRQYIGRNCEK